MGKKLDALLGKGFKTAKFKATVNLAVSRLAVLKNQRQARYSLAQSDVVQLLNLGHHERALLRVEQVIKEQNMLDVYVMIEGYFHLLIERVNLIEHERVCPEELKEAISSLIYAATRCGDFPELQEIRAIFNTRFGREFTARASELRNNCGVNLKMIQKLSTRMPSLENRLKVLKEIASENNIILQIEETSSGTTEYKFESDEIQQQSQTKRPDTSANHGGGMQGDTAPFLPENNDVVEDFPAPSKARKQKYKDVADAAQAAFESAAYAATAARAALELSRSESRDPDDHDSPHAQPRKAIDTLESMKSKLQADEETNPRRKEEINVGLGSEEIHPIQNCDSESEDEAKGQETKQSNNKTELSRSLSTSSSDSADNMLKGDALFSQVEVQTRSVKSEVVFDETDDESENKQKGLPWSRTDGHRMTDERADNIISVDSEDLHEGSRAKPWNISGVKYPLKFKNENYNEPYAEGFITHGAEHLMENKPISVRTRRGRGY